MKFTEFLLKLFFLDVAGCFFLILFTGFFLDEFPTIEEAIHSFLLGLPIVSVLLLFEEARKRKWKRKERVESKILACSFFI